jgi:outer membrane protein assembly factor BamB
MNDMLNRISRAATLAALVSTAAPLSATPAQEPGDWPQWGRDHTRNMVSGETGLPSSFDAGEYVGNTDEIDFSTTRNVRWIAKLGSQAYGNPTIAGGRVYVGTNNDSPRDPRFRDDRCCVYCFDEKTGEFLWELNIPKLGTGKVSDWEYLGICSSPAIVGDRVYLVSNRCEVLCLDAEGMANGNDGPFQDEGQYMAGPGETPVRPERDDGDIIWSLNMIDECGVFPHNITSCSVLVIGDRVWSSTSNGVDYGHVETPAPFAPSLIVVDKATGALVGEESSGCSERIFHANWSSPAYLRTDALELGIFGGPDGWVYAFEPEAVEDEEGYQVLVERWRCDANPPEYRVDEEGKRRKYATRGGPSEVLGTPIVWDGKVYAVIGQDPEHGEGVGNLVCIDPSGEGDVTGSKQVWSYDKIHRSISTPSIADGRLYVADFSGFIYCLDAKTGEELWVHDTLGHIWSSTLVADGRVYIANEDGYMTILPATAEYDKENAIEIDMTSSVYASAVAANGALYVATHTHLFAFAEIGEDE